MDYKIVVTAEAEEDLNQFIQYLLFAKKNKQAAKNVLDDFEFKQILDTIASYVLVDDTGLFCDSYHTTELGNYDHTVIFVMEPEIFPGWLKDRKASIKTISEIS